MKLVIEIDEDTYRYMQSRCKYQNKGDKGLSKFEEVGVAIKNGTPLPKGHGRLVDFSEVLIKLMQYYDGDKTIGQCLDEVNTIIEADGGE